MTNNQFSVLMSVYYKEKAEYLAVSLNSITKDQTLLPTEIVLVKDGPLTPELDSVCEEYKTIYPDIFKIIALPENVGLGRALNEGLKHCSYDLVARMDSDDISKPNRFMKQIELMNSRPDISIVGSWVEFFEGTTDNIIALKRRPQDGEELLSYAKQRTPLSHPSVMFRKQDVVNVGGYQHMHLMEDYYLWIRLVNAGYTLYNIQESLLFFRTSHDVMKRRGGLKYAVSEYKLFKYMKQESIIDNKKFAVNMLTRFPVRIMPAFIRGFVYRYIMNNHN